MKRLFKKLFPSKEMRAYRKMHKRHRKELVKHAKETREYDWGWLHDSIIMQIRHMHEYYTAGNNVWQADEKRLMVIEQLKHILDLDEKIDKMQDEDDGVQYVHENGKVTCVFPDNYKEYVKNYEKREQELYEELYSSIGEHLRWWWD